MGVYLLPHRHGNHTLRPGFVVPDIVCSERILSRKEDLRGQTIAVIGLGASGRAAAKLALARGAAVLAVDRNENLVIPENDPLLAKNANLQTILGPSSEDLLKDADRVVVSPGVPLENYNLADLLQSGKQVVSELDFAAEVLPNSIRILAVTGTNGKSTVATFAGQMLHHLGIKAFVGGNLGSPLSEAAIRCLGSSSTGPMLQVAVVEVSSYQMEIPNKYFCPFVAVALNLTPDHLERHNTMWNYAATKCRVFTHMNHSNLAVLPIGDQLLKDAFSDYAERCNVAWIGDLPGVMIDVEAKVASLSIPTTGLVAQLELGSLDTFCTHNFCNAAVAAFCVLGLDVGADVDSINAMIERLSPPPHRMQIVYRDSRGVTWVDDSKATNVEATSAGLMGLKEQKSVVLLGGLAKVLKDEGSGGFEKLVEFLKIPPSYHYSSGTIIQKTLVDAGLSIPCIRATNMKDAVKFARNIAAHGDAIVLSPGCASFDEFQNFEHRGKVFQELAFSVQ